MKKNLPVTGKEQLFGDDVVILSTTDPKGIITYTNEDFRAVSGFGEDELIAKNHNVVRHPDMPPAAFADLWTTLKAGRSWMGIVKNRCKNGDHYWVDAYVTPMLRGDKIVEHQSVRRKASRENIRRAERFYARLAAGKLPHWLRIPTPGLRTRLFLAFSLALAPALVAASVSGAASTSIAAGLLLSLGLGYGAIHLLTAPLLEAVEAARRVVDNKIIQHVYTGRHDEAGQLLAALRFLEAETGGVVGRIADSAKGLADNAQQLAETAELNSEAMLRQHGETDQAAAAIHEMSTSIQAIADSARQAADAADSAHREAETGSRVVAANRDAIGSLAGDLRDVAQVIAKLDQDSEKISTVLAVIKGIAEQTNLLALNAAIEAARAGELGRGFAVVADEVRTLATRSQESTQEIQKVIENLQATTRQAVDAMARSSEQTEQSVEQANQANVSLKAITCAVATIKDMSIHIAGAVEQQSAASEDINRSVTNIRQASEQTVSGVTRTEQAGKRIAELAGRLQELAIQFNQRRHGR